MEITDGVAVAGLIGLLLVVGVLPAAEVDGETATDVAVVKDDVKVDGAVIEGCPPLAATESNIALDDMTG